MSKKRRKSKAAQPVIPPAGQQKKLPAQNVVENSAPSFFVSERPGKSAAFLFWISAFIIVAMAMFFRLYHLGRPSLRADTIVFWNYCVPKLGFTDVYRLWMSELNMKGSGQFPFALAFTKGFLNLFQLPLNQFNLRLPSAIWGVLAVMAALGCGKNFFGVWHGLLFAAMMAVNPFHIGTTREAYYYPAMTLGNVLLLWAVVVFVKAWLQRAQPPRRFYLLFAFGLFLSTHVQASSWPFAALSCGIVFLLFLFGIKTGRRFLPSGALCLLILVAIGLPLLTAEWGVEHMIFISTGEHKAYSAMVFGASATPLWQMIATVGARYAWGETPMRLVMAVVFFLLGLLGTVRLWNRAKIVRIFPVYFSGIFILFVLAQAMAGLAGASRYLLPLLPIYQAFLAFGVVALVQWLAARGRGRFCLSGAAAAMACLAVGMNVRPAWIYTRLSGKPTPYADIKNWADTAVPANTLILVDRWFEPWNELLVYASTNAVFTFTLPNEPPENLIAGHWRGSVTNFLKRFQDAAYLELNQSYANVTNQGPWPWLHQWFPRRVAFTNEAGLKLRELGLANREDYFDPATNRLVVSIYYRTREDAIEQARAGGESCVLFFGPKWAYLKPWRETGSFMDLRVLGPGAGLDIYNLTDAPVIRSLSVSGTAVNGTKHVGIGGERIAFPQGRQSRLLTPPFELKPGSNHLELVDPAGPASRSILLVNDIGLVDPSSPPAANEKFQNKLQRK